MVNTWYDVVTAWRSLEEEEKKDYLFYVNNLIGQPYTGEQVAKLWSSTARRSKKHLLPISTDETIPVLNRIAEGVYIACNNPNRDFKLAATLLHENLPPVIITSDKLCDEVAYTMPRVLKDAIVSTWLGLNTPCGNYNYETGINAWRRMCQQEQLDIILEQLQYLPDVPYGTAEAVLDAALIYAPNMPTAMFRLSKMFNLVGKYYYDSGQVSDIIGNTACDFIHTARCLAKYICGTSTPNRSTLAKIFVDVYLYHMNLPPCISDLTDSGEDCYIAYHKSMNAVLPTKGRRLI